MKFSDLKSHITKEQLHPCYCLYGSDAWVVSSAYKMFDSIVSDSSFDLERFDNGEDINRVLASCETISMFGGRRVIKAGLMSVNKDVLTALSKYLSRPNPSAILVFKCGTDMPDKLSGLAGIAAVDCNRLDNSLIVKWAKRESISYGATLSDGAAMLLVKYTLGDMSRISQEIVKLATYKNNGIIEPIDVEELVSADVEYKIFALTDALIARNVGLSYDVLDKLLKDRNQPIALLGLMAASYRRLLYARLSGSDPSLPKYLGVKDGAVRIAERQAKSYTKRQLYDIVKKFAKADLEFKSGGISGRAGLEKLLCEIIACR